MSRCFWIAAMAWVALAPSAAGQVTTEQATARRLPWSGYWWPIAKGEIFRPLRQYDQLTGAGAAPWEWQRHPPGPDVPEWHGYCHAWAAASVLEHEPRAPQSATGPISHARLLLSVGDQKGLLTISHTRDAAHVYGDRFGDGAGSEDPLDLAPDYLWQLLKLYIKQQGVPLIFDLDAGPEVWNYPVFAYRVQFAPVGPGDDLQRAQLSLWAVDDAVPPDHVGMMLQFQTYTFTFRLRNAAVVMGSGRWAGNSVVDHPDFAWYPYVPLPENPHIQYPTVKRLVAAVGRTGPEAGASGAAPSSGGVPAGEHAPRPETPAGATLPQGTPISPQQLVAAIAEKTSTFGLDVTVDRFDGGHYAVGDPCTVNGTSQRAGHLWLFHLNGAGELSAVWPGPGQDNRILAGRRFSVPPPGSGAAFALPGPFGVHRIKALVTDRPLLLTGLTWPESQQAKTLLQVGRFRWCPTQRSQVKALLQEYHSRSRLPQDKLDAIELKKVLGDFAQDEVAFYVGPHEETRR